MVLVLIIYANVSLKENFNNLDEYQGKKYDWDTNYHLLLELQKVIIYTF